MVVKTRPILSRAELTKLEMARGKQVAEARAEWDGTPELQKIFSRRFNPDHVEVVEVEETYAKPPDKESREYKRRMQEANKDRWGD